MKIRIMPPRVAGPEFDGYETRLGISHDDGPEPSEWAVLRGYGKTKRESIMEMQKLAQSMWMAARDYWHEGWPVDHEADCPAEYGLGACRCPMGNL
jgi:hypothetical protein